MVLDVKIECCTADDQLGNITPRADETITPMAAHTVCPLEEYKRVEPLVKAPLKAGSSYYIVNRRWYTEWQQWVGHPYVQSPQMRPSSDPLLPVDMCLDGDVKPSTKRSRAGSWTKERPGEIDNSELLEEGSMTAMRRCLTERSDYEIVPEDAWNLLYSWYGGGPPIKRRAIQLPSGVIQVELHGLQLKVYRSTDTAGPPFEVIESKCTTIKELKASLCREFDLQEDKVRLWDYFDNRPCSLLDKNDEKTLESCGISDNNPILLEEQNQYGSFSLKDPENDAMDTSTSATTSYPSTSSSRYNSSSYSYSSYSGAVDVPTVGEPIQRGAVGLQNLGNTCFMNSSIQCLSNIPALREFFISEEYKASLNRQAHKTQGKLAEGFAGLLSLMWKDDTTKVAPRNFKYQVGQFAEQFSGYGQQDSMELIEYVLDGLKEDCNRVQGAKAYIELKEAEGRSDDDVAREALDAYRQRSNSKVDDLFTGLFKSVVRCPEPQCGRQSITFDPFLSVKLGLTNAVEQRMISVSLTVVRESKFVTSWPYCTKEVTVKVNKDGSVKSLVEAVAKDVGEGLKPEKCILIEVYMKKVQKFFEETESVGTIRSDDQLFLFEVADARAFNVSTAQRWGSGMRYPVSAVSDDQGDDSSPSSPSSSSCGAIIVHRQKGSKSVSYAWSSSYAGRQIQGWPLLISVPKEATGRMLYKEVDRRIRELLYDSDSINIPAWKLYKADKYSLSSEGTLVNPDCDEVIEGKDVREYFALEWEEGATLPSRLVSFPEDSKRYASNSFSREVEVDLQRLLQLFVEDEQLGPDDAWYCNRCKEHKEAWKKLEFHQTPAVLVIQLKRFQYTRWSRERLNTPVKFPVDGLDLTPYLTASASSDPDRPTAVYDLAGFSKHIGSLGGGHYVAYCRSSIDGEWYHFDDSSVYKCGVQEVQDDKVGAYVLFYIRRDHRPSTFGPPASPQPGSPESRTWTSS